MHFEEDNIYHVYNRSNELLFYCSDNYNYFIRKLWKYIYPYCEILAWCLLPNHFHLMILARFESVQYINEPHRNNTQLISKNIGIILSSYTQAINKQVNRKGSLFSYHTKAKTITDRKNQYIKTCFNYIHQNPCLAGLANKPEDWEFSSYSDFINERTGDLTNIKLAELIINFDKDNFAEWSKALIDSGLIKHIW